MSQIYEDNSPSSLESNRDEAKLQAVWAGEDFPWSGTGSFVIRSFAKELVPDFCYVTSQNPRQQKILAPNNMIVPG